MKELGIGVPKKVLRAETLCGVALLTARRLLYAD